MSALKTLGKMLGLVGEPAADILHNETAARAVLSRRNLFAGDAALVGGKAFSGDVFSPPSSRWADWEIFSMSAEHWSGFEGDFIRIYTFGLKSIETASRF